MFETKQDELVESPSPRKVLVVGATGGTGRATVARLLREGHEVTAFARSADKLGEFEGRIRIVSGDATNPQDVDRAVRGQEVVIVILGIRENPVRVRMFGTSRTPADVRSAGTRNVIESMQQHGVRRLIVQSSYGVGETRDNLRMLDRLFFRLILEPQIADTEAQEQIVRESGLDWVLAQPVHLTDDEARQPAFSSTAGEVRVNKISRGAVAGFLSELVVGSSYTRQSVALSG